MSSGQQLPKQSETVNSEPGVKMTQLEKKEEERNQSGQETDEARGGSVKSKQAKDEDVANNERDVQVDVSKPESSVNREAADGSKSPDVRPTFVESFLGGGEIPDINFYQHKKTLAKGMMDLALFSANSNQLRYVLECRERHPYFYPSLILISFSLICQVAVGITLLWNAMYNVKHEMPQANKVNNYSVMGIFLVTVINVFVSAFGVANPPPVK